MAVTTQTRVPPAVRWTLWLAAGVVFGLLFGFAVGLAKPRIRN